MATPRHQRRASLDGRRASLYLLGVLCVTAFAMVAMSMSEHNDTVVLTIAVLSPAWAVALVLPMLVPRGRELLDLRPMATVFEHANEALLVVNAHGTIRACNPATARLFGLGVPELVGTRLELVAPELGAALGARAVVLEARVRVRGREPRVVRASVAPTSLVDGRPGAWVLALHDTTREHEAERMKRDFVATVSHELRTPLTTIRGFLETMRRDDLHLDDAQTTTFLDIMRGEAVRLDRLINDLLDTSAIEAGRPPSVRICTVDLVDEVRRAVTSFRAARPAVVVRFREEDVREPVVVRVDPDRLQQVLTNLLENAHRHGASEQPIEVRVNPERLGRAGVCVRDHGRGIAPEDQGHIFERFFFTADSATRHGGGAGLGLYICQRLMQAMDGRIDVHSVPGCGSTFTIQMPGVARRAQRRRFPSVSVR